MRRGDIITNHAGVTAMLDGFLTDDTGTECFKALYFDNVVSFGSDGMFEASDVRYATKEQIDKFTKKLAEYLKGAYI